MLQADDGEELPEDLDLLGRDDDFALDRPADENCTNRFVRLIPMAVDFLDCGFRGGTVILPVGLRIKLNRYWYQPAAGNGWVGRWRTCSGSLSGSDVLRRGHFGRDRIRGTGEGGRWGGLIHTDNAWIVAKNRDFSPGHMMRWTKKPRRYRRGLGIGWPGSDVPVFPWKNQFGRWSTGS